MYPPPSLFVTLLAAAPPTFSSAPLYALLPTTSGCGPVGQVLAAIVVMIVTAAISFWLFYPIFKLIFRQQPEAPRLAAAPTTR